MRIKFVSQIIPSSVDIFILAFWNTDLKVKNNIPLFPCPLPRVFNGKGERGEAHRNRESGQPTPTLLLFSLVAGRAPWNLQNPTTTAVFSNSIRVLLFLLPGDVRSSESKLGQSPAR